MWKNPFIAGALCVSLLAGCGGNYVTTYNLAIAGVKKEQQQEILNAVDRVMKRHIAGFKMDARATVNPRGEGGELTITFKDPQSKKVLSESIERPFTFEIKSLTLGITDISKAELADWHTTGVTGKDLSWIQAIGDKATGKIGVELQFTENGRERFSAAIQSLSKEAAMKSPSTEPVVGVFVRDVLVSTLQVTGDDVSKRIIISGIPSPAIAQVFADDVNVGLHVTFVPR